MDGYQAIQKIKENEAIKSIPIIVLTASAMKQSEQAIEELCDVYLRKPVSQNQLVTELMKFLKHSVKIVRHSTKESLVASDSKNKSEAEGSPGMPDHTEDPEKLLELIKILEENLNSQSFKEMCETLTINEVEDFIIAMRELCVQYAYPPLIKWEEELESELSLFEMDGLSKTLEMLPHLIHEAHSLVQKKP